MSDRSSQGDTTSIEPEPETDGKTPGTVCALDAKFGSPNLVLALPGAATGRASLPASASSLYIQANGHIQASSLDQAGKFGALVRVDNPDAGGNSSYPVVAANDFVLYFVAGNGVGTDVPYMQTRTDTTTGFNLIEGRTLPLASSVGGPPADFATDFANTHGVIEIRLNNTNAELHNTELLDGGWNITALTVPAGTNPSTPRLTSDGLVLVYSTGKTLVYASRNAVTQEFGTGTQMNEIAPVGSGDLYAAAITNNRCRLFYVEADGTTANLWVVERKP